MLILTRQPCQSIRIGDAITITLLEVIRGEARIGIDAPREIPVHREEVYLRIQAEGISHEELTLEEVVLDKGTGTP